MAYVNQTYKNFGIVEFVNSKIETLKSARARYAIYQETKRELESLNSRELSDIGISRADIARLAKEAAAAV